MAAPGSRLLDASTTAPAPSDDVMHSLVPTVPDALEFETWWTERDTRRFMLLLFFPATNQLQALVDDSKVPLTMAVMTKAGTPLRAWDLHVGAVIDVLGRATTLQSATMRTVAWLDSTAKRLWKRKEALERTLNKFRVKTAVALDYGAFKKLALMPGPSQSLGGTCNIATLCRCVHRLEVELATYQ